jgi:hypothetical protein
MTQLRRRVKREVNRYVIQLEPPKRDEPAIIKIKEKGKRKWFEVTIEQIYWLAIRKSAEKIIAERREMSLSGKRRKY